MIIEGATSEKVDQQPKAVYEKLRGVFDPRRLSLTISIPLRSRIKWYPAK